MDKAIITDAIYYAENGENYCVSATINGTQMSVPLDLNNRHYAEIMRQVEAGELTIQEASE